MAVESKPDVKLSSQEWTLISSTKCIIQCFGGSCRLAFGTEPTTTGYGLLLSAGESMTYAEDGNCYAIAEKGMSVKISTCGGR